MVGESINGEFTYTNNTVWYTQIGNLLFFKLSLVTSEMIVHPTGAVHVRIPLPSEILRLGNPIWSNAHVSYSDGGYDDSFRKILFGDFKKSGNELIIMLRGYREPDPNNNATHNITSALSFVDSIDNYDKRSNSIYLVNEQNQTVTLQMGGYALFT